MPLAIYTLLGNPTALPSYPRQPPAIPAVSIPAVRGFRSNWKTYLSSTSLIEKGNHLYLCCWGCSVRSFLIYCESDPPSNGDNSFTSIASLVPSDEMMYHFLSVLGTDSQDEYSSALRITKNLPSKSRLGRSGDRCCSEKQYSARPARTMHMNSFASSISKDRSLVPL